jgi:DNA-binding NarL/FixJ family response regulator
LLTDAGIEVTARSGTADELLVRVAEYPPDAVVVDIRLPPTHTEEGMRAAQTIRQQHPGLGVLVLSQYVEVGLAMQLLADSAEGVGYLLKERVSEVKQFIAALHRVADGGSALDPTIVSMMLKRHRSSDPLDALTPREREVLELMATGASNAGIAESMVIPQSAAEKYVSTVFAKLGSRPQEANHDGVLAVLLFLRA